MGQALKALWTKVGLRISCWGRQVATGKFPGDTVRVGPVLTASGRGTGGKNRGDPLGGYRAGPGKG